ncbi:hypothetical protein [Niallia taxi]|uniref:hypothetical protein n=1 Tax=Niallia taxi TaxID=2499688 RepID=UPI00300A2627
MIDKIQIVVYAEVNEKEKYFNLFSFLFKDKIINLINNNDRKEIHTEQFNVKFLSKLHSTKGYKAHYVLNLTQDIDFHREVAKPVEALHYQLEHNDQWNELLFGIHNSKVVDLKAVLNKVCNENNPDTLSYSKSELETSLSKLKDN